MKLILTKPIFMIIVIFLASCGRHCISFSGEYQGIDGKIDYCFSKSESDNSGVPALENGGKTSYLFTYDQVARILENINDKEMVMEKAIKEDYENPVRRLLRKIRGKK